MSDLKNKFDTNIKIGVFAPSSYVDTARFDNGLKTLRSYGFDVYAHPQCYKTHGQSAGTDKEKLDALYELFNDSALDVVMAAGGGNRALHLLDQIDFAKLRGSQKLYCGYSDSTALSFALHSQVNISSIYGPMVQNVNDIDVKDLEYFLSLISGKQNSYDFGVDATVLKEGNIGGRLIGGTLSMLPALTGTQYMPALDGHILYIEDCNEELSRLDRMLCHLKMSMPFNKLGGLIIGDFKNLTDTGRPYGFTLEQIINEHIDVINGPVIMNAPFGHGNRMQALPFGVQGQLDAQQSKISLSF